MKQQEFLNAANGTARARTFDATAYSAFSDAVKQAKKAAKNGMPYFAESSAGGVANKYGHGTTTARWGVYVAPDGTITQTVGRYSVCGRHVSSVFYGGERAYQKWYRDIQRTALALIAEYPDKTQTILAAYRACCAVPTRDLCIGYVRSLEF